MGDKTKNFLRKNWLILTIIFLVLIWFTYSYASKGIIYQISNSDVDGVINIINSFGVWAWLIFILLVVLEVVLAPIPPLLLYVASGFIFGAFLGGFITLIGNLIGAGIAYFIAHRFGRKVVEKQMNKKIRKKFDNFSKKYGGFAIFLLRINPLTTTDLVSYLAGLSNIRFWKFLFWTGLGLTPMIFLQTYLGDFFVRGNSILSTLVIILSVIYFILFVYLIIRIFIKKKIED